MPRPKVWLGYVGQTIVDKRYYSDGERKAWCGRLPSTVEKASALSSHEYIGEAAVKGLHGGKERLDQTIQREVEDLTDRERSFPRGYSRSRSRQAATLVA